MPAHVNEDSVAIRGLSEEDVADLKEAFDNFDRNKVRADACRCLSASRCILL